MVEIAGRPLLGHIADAYRAAGIREVTAVRGYARDRVDLADIRYVDNDDYAETGELVSLACGLDGLGDRFPAVGRYRAVGGQGCRG